MKGLGASSSEKDKGSAMHRGSMALPKTHLSLSSGSGKSSQGPNLHKDDGGEGGDEAGRDRNPEQTADSEQRLERLANEGEGGVSRRVKDEECESRSASDADRMSVGYEGERPNKKSKRYHRHTPQQIQEMEQLFKECPHPDEKQRLELSQSLGLEPRQVKFWFQNRRTQMKAHTERAENSLLRAENDQIRAENLALRDALKSATCPQCGSAVVPGPPPELAAEASRLAEENSRLKAEVERVSAIAARQLAAGGASEGGTPSGGRSGKADLGLSPRRPPEPISGGPAQPMGGGGPGGDPAAPPDGMHAGGRQAEGGPPGAGGGGGGRGGGGATANQKAPAGGLSESEKELVYELAMSTMEELVQMAQMDEPLWVGTAGERERERLQVDEYLRRFPNRLGPSPAGLSREASRASGLVMMNGAALVEVLLDPVRWTELFPCLIARAVTVDLVSAGAGQGNRSGALQLMYAETQVLSPLVPTRESFFLRYCTTLSEGCWGVADVSVDSLRSDPPPVMLKCRRRPSGCIIQDMPNGCSKVTFVDHLEVDDSRVHRLFRPLVTSTAAFGAARWLAVLQRQCVRLAALLGTVTSRDTGMSSVQGRRALLRLAQRMATNFSSGVSASTQHTWTALSGSEVEDVRVTTRQSLDTPGEPHGVILSAATTMWIKTPPHHVFDFLRNEQTRNEWDILANGGIVSEMGHIAKGQDPGNCVSLLKVQAPNRGQGSMLILQESCTDASGAMIVYAPVDIPAMQQVLGGGDPDYVALLPSGFVILPDAASPAERGVLAGLLTPVESASEGITQGGSLLTVAFQILVSPLPQAKLSLESVATVNSLISCTVKRIRHALQCPAP